MKRIDAIAAILVASLRRREQAALAADEAGAEVPEPPASHVALTDRFIEVAGLRRTKRSA